MNITAYEYDTILPSCVQLLSLTLAHRLRVTELSILEDKNRIHVLPHEDIVSSSIFGTLVSLIIT